MVLVDASSAGGFGSDGLPAHAMQEPIVVDVPLPERLYMSDMALLRTLLEREKERCACPPSRRARIRAPDRFATFSRVGNRIEGLRVSASSLSGPRVRVFWILDRIRGASQGLD